MGEVFSSEGGLGADKDVTDSDSGTTSELF